MPRKPTAWYPIPRYCTTNEGCVDLWVRSCVTRLLTPSGRGRVFAQFLTHSSAQHAFDDVLPSLAQLD